MKQPYNIVPTVTLPSNEHHEGDKVMGHSTMAVFDYWQQQPSNSFSADSATSSSLSSGSFDQSSESSPSTSPDRRRRTPNKSQAAPSAVYPFAPQYHGGYYFPKEHRPKKTSSPPTRIPEWSPQQCVALDAEMVGVGQYGTNSSVARVVVVDWYGEVLFDEYIKQTQQVTDYRTFVSGITEDNLIGATLSLRDARKTILNILYGRFLIGHGLRNDLKALGISHPWWLIRDVSEKNPSDHSALHGISNPYP